MSESDYKIIGVDLAAQPKATGVCVIHVKNGKISAAIPSLPAGHEKWTDDALLQKFAEEGVRRIAIDAPFDWPSAFVDALMTYIGLKQDS